MTWWEWLIIGVIVAFVVAVIVAAIVRRKQGKTGCDCGCSSCAGCKYAHLAENKAPSDKTDESSAK